MVFPELEFYDYIGSLGVAIILLCFFLLQIGKIHQDQLGYSLGNLTGASLILFSLYFEFNLPSAILEGIWVSISLIGITRYALNKKKTKQQSIQIND